MSKCPDLTNIITMIPVCIEITRYTPGVPGYYGGRPENCEPPEPPEIEFKVRTLSGHELTEDDFDWEAWEKLSDDVFTAVEAEIARRERYDDGY